MSLDGIIYIFTPVHNRRKITENFVKCLLSQFDKKFHFCLIDDGSTDGTSEMVQTNLPNATIIKGDGNLWWGGALQEGYKWLSSQKISENDIVLLINDDVSFGPLYLSEARRLLEEDPRAAICSQYFDLETGLLLDRGARCDFETFFIEGAKNDAEIAFLSTRGLFLRARDFINSGGFVPDQLPHYLSDYEFTFRLKKKLGLALKTSHEIPVFGINDQSGVPDVATYTPFKALSVIFSKRFHGNPVYTSNFIKLCFPEKYVKLHTRRIWSRVPINWAATFPIWVYILARIFYTATISFVRNEVRREIHAARELMKRKNRKLVKISAPQPSLNAFSRYIDFPSFESANCFAGENLSNVEKTSSAMQEISSVELSKLLLSYAISERGLANSDVYVVGVDNSSEVLKTLNFNGAVQLKTVAEANQIAPSENCIVVIDEKSHYNPNFKASLEALMDKNIKYLLFLNLPSVEGDQNSIGFAGGKTPAFFVSWNYLHKMIYSKFEKMFEYSSQSKRYHLVGRSIIEVTGLYRQSCNKR